ncbi:MAG: hypothetical protein VXX37_00400, partial [Pseudomonadota bacterium]|nr:hypothetical protein [Pseudomonadota bacterium]
LYAALSSEQAGTAFQAPKAAIAVVRLPSVRAPPNKTLFATLSNIYSRSCRTIIGAPIRIIAQFSEKYPGELAVKWVKNSL